MAGSIEIRSPYPGVFKLFGIGFTLLGLALAIVFALSYAGLTKGKAHDLVGDVFLVGVTLAVGLVSLRVWRDVEVSVSPVDRRIVHTVKTPFGGARRTEFSFDEVKVLSIRGTINWVGAYLVLADGSELPLRGSIPRTDDGKRRLREVIDAVAPAVGCRLQVSETIASWFGLSRTKGP